MIPGGMGNSYCPCPSTHMQEDTGKKTCPCHPRIWHLIYEMLYLAKTLSHALQMAYLFIFILLLAGCQNPHQPSPIDTIQSSNENHVRFFGDFDLPRKIGMVENIGLQIPAISPDGSQILYLRTTGDTLSPMTLLGSPEPKDTPPQGILSIWLRPTEGSALGRRISTQRWAHSPVWSDSGKAIVYVANIPPASSVIHMDLTTGQQTVLGLAGAINCIPRFDNDDHTVLFCAAAKRDEPFRVYRQAVGQSKPTPLTPEGMDCLFPLLGDKNGVLCARVEGDHLNWTRVESGGVKDIIQNCGLGQRPEILQTLAGITYPVSPDRQNFLFYDSAHNRICIYHQAHRLFRRHHPDSIAVCWLTNDAVALATNDRAFAVNTQTGMSLQLFNGLWIPCRYVPMTRTLFLLGKESSNRLAVVEVKFKNRETTQ